MITDYSGDIFRQTDFDGDSDFEVLLSQDSRAASTLIYQDIPIPDLNLDLSFSAKVYAMSTLPAWAAAMVMIEYLDQNHNLLGDTRFCTLTNYCEWENSTTSHLIEIESEDWEDYTLNLNDEMAFLDEVPPELIKSIRITAGTVIYDC